MNQSNEGVDFSQNENEGEEGMEEEGKSDNLNDSGI